MNTEQTITLTLNEQGTFFKMNGTININTWLDSQRLTKGHQTISINKMEIRLMKSSFIKNQLFLTGELRTESGSIMVDFSLKLPEPQEDE